MTRKILISLSEMHKGNGDGGYLHLDIQPSNIFVENVSSEKIYEGEDLNYNVKFLDLVTALRVINGKIIKETDAYGAWTQGYSAPEVIRGEIECYGLYTDLYSVGAILYRMVSGKKIDLIDSYKATMDEENTVYMILSKVLACMVDEYTGNRYRTAEEALRDINNIQVFEKDKKEHRYYDYYAKVFDYLGDNICIKEPFSEVRRNSFYEAVDLLEKDLIRRISQAKRNLFIYEHLWSLFEKLSDCEQQIIKEKLICCGIACNNHIGRSKCSIELYNMLDAEVNCYDIQQILSAQTRVITAYEDLGMIREAREMCRSIICELETVIKSITADQSSGLKRCTQLGRAYSSYARLNAYYGDDQETVKFFIISLKEFEGDIENTKITLSHYLQYIIHVSDRCTFDKYISGYFGRDESISEHIDRILKYDDKVFRQYAYEILICLKASYKWGDELSEDQLEDILYRTSVAMDRQHPVELILRYIGILLFYRSKGANMLFKNAFERADEWFHRDYGILSLIRYRTVWIYRKLLNEDTEDLFKEYCNIVHREGLEKLVHKSIESCRIEPLKMYEYE